MAALARGRWRAFGVCVFRTHLLSFFLFFFPFVNPEARQVKRKRFLVLIARELFHRKSCDFQDSPIIHAERREGKDGDLNVAWPVMINIYDPFDFHRVDSSRPYQSRWRAKDVECTFDWPMSPMIFFWLIISSGWSSLRCRVPKMYVNDDLSGRRFWVIAFPRNDRADETDVFLLLRLKRGSLSRDFVRIKELYRLSDSSLHGTVNVR